MPPHRYCTLECHYDTWKRSPIFSQSMIRLLETVDQRSPTRNSNLYFLVRDLQIATLLHANFPISVSFLFFSFFLRKGNAQLYLHGSADPKDFLSKVSTSMGCVNSCNMLYSIIVNSGGYVENSSRYRSLVYRFLAWTTCYYYNVAFLARDFVWIPLRASRK